jgi:hypothetical protein
MKLPQADGPQSPTRVRVVQKFLGHTLPVNGCETQAVSRRCAGAVTGAGRGRGAFAGMIGFRMTHRWREMGFELPVPRERDLNLTLCRTAGTASSNKSEVRARSAMPIRVGLNALFHDKRLSNPSPA